MPAKLEQLNLTPDGDAEIEFLKCCGSKEWARQMAAARPFASLNELTESADRIWWSLQPRDWLEAFQSHPKIGEKKAAAATAAESQKWSAAEQSGIRDSAQETLRELAELNREYEQKFGFIFIVCATGKSSSEMLTILKERIKNDPDEEIRIAAGEQARITELRLRKLVDSTGP